MRFFLGWAVLVIGGLGGGLIRIGVVRDGSGDNRGLMASPIVGVGLCDELTSGWIEYFVDPLE